MGINYSDKLPSLLEHEQSLMRGLLDHVAAETAHNVAAEKELVVLFTLLGADVDDIQTLLDWARKEADASRPMMSYGDHLAEMMARVRAVVRGEIRLMAMRIGG